MSDAYVITHIATTCDEFGIHVTKDSSELIELAWIIVDAKTLQEISRQSVLVQPVNTPVTSFCTSQTTLTWDILANAGTFQNAITLFARSIELHLISRKLEFTIVSLNSWDIRLNIPREAHDKGISLPVYLKYPRMFDLRNEFNKWNSHHPEVPHHHPVTFASICVALEIDPVNSNHHAPLAPKRAIEEASTLVRVLQALIKKSQPLELHPDVLSHPHDSHFDLQAFLSERSTILFMTNLPHDTTQKSLKPTGTGFALFSSHEDAIFSLSAMNGRALNDRVIEVAPSGHSVFERASDILVVFPSSKNRPRPGDWNCPSCGFSNFQRRVECFRCSYPYPGIKMFNYGQQQSQQQPSQKNLQYQSLQNGQYSQYQQAQLHPQQSDLENDKALREDYLGPVSMASNYEGIYDLEEDPGISPMGKYGNLGVHNNNTNDDKRIMSHNFSSSASNINTSIINPNNNNNLSNINNNSNISNNGSSSNANTGNNNNNNNNSNQVPFRAGDWKCKTEGCNYHNFAKNTNCLRCGAVREMPRRSASTNSYSYKQRRTLSGLPDQLPSIPDGSKQQQHQQQKKMMMRSLSLHHHHNSLGHFSNGSASGVGTNGARNAGVNSLVSHFGNFTVEEH
ncbi:hypothetical protein DV451_002050 [Geotrichum candidum]|uniref:RanBP2-type domain-containing protein n=1 Tax=Geotrichum candidum TaxID=1173061 RepID=A0A9P5KUV4_GEOCN|nr:hypothetical protein DV451_002050 [Geotrichum candidum]KAF5108463.1 hypothetical protein DV453_002249 [Geotrichum candidum]